MKYRIKKVVDIGRTTYWVYQEFFWWYAPIAKMDTKEEAEEYIKLLKENKEEWVV